MTTATPPAPVREPAHPPVLERTPALPDAPSAPASVQPASPQPPTWQVAVRGLATGAFYGAILITAINGLNARIGFGWVVDLLVFAVLGFLLVSLFNGAAALVWWILGLPLRKWAPNSRARRALQAFRPDWLGALVGAAALILVDVLFPDTFLKTINLATPTEIYLPILALTGMLLALARAGAKGEASAMERVDGAGGLGRTLQPYAHRRGAVLLGAAALLNVSMLGYIAWRGTDDYVARAELTPAAGVGALDLPDPGQPGPYAVQTLTYGSGTDLRRPEYGAEAALLTPVLDGTPIFAGYNLPGKWLFEAFWGFDFSQLPLNGRVWYPEGAGPFPLVLAVHGNHAMSDFSDPGYAYLGEHLASRGMIFVSVDENFLNGFWLDDGQFNELPQRAWLLLEHLRQWRAWNETPGNQFYGQVDLERVGLVGHSRGGEAAAYAADLNQRVAAPVSEVAQTDDFGFGIRGVVAIAPSDGHAKLNGSSPTLRHTDYLLLIGGHDTDTFINYGAAQYNRVSFGENPGGFRAMAYLYRANHGQFNTVWGDADQGPLTSLMLNRAPLLDGEAQRQAARVLITAFLEASLNDAADYRAVFYNPASAAAWLPGDLLVTAYQDETFRMVSGLDRKPGRDRLDVDGGGIAAEGVSEWVRGPLLLRDGETQQGNAAARLEWTAGMRPVYSLTLPEGQAAAWALSPLDSLTLALGPAGDDPLPLSVDVSLETADGIAATLPLSQFGALHPPLPARQLKGDWFAWLMSMKYDVAWPAEIVLQTYDLPLEAFQAAGPGFRPQAITAIRLSFDGPQGGSVYVDTVAFRGAP